MTECVEPTIEGYCGNSGFSQQFAFRSHQPYVAAASTSCFHYEGCCGYYTMFSFYQLFYYDLIIIVNRTKQLLNNRVLILVIVDVDVDVDNVMAFLP